MLSNLGKFPECFPRCIILGALLLTLASCGGRVAREVPVSNPHDGRLTCLHLKAESEANLERIADIAAEKDDQANQNVGKVFVIGLVWMNLNDSEKKEIEALQARNRELDRLRDKKNCDPQG